MCGICGVVAQRGGALGISRSGFEHMRDKLSHRGPDDAGLHFDEHQAVALGHRRLSIIDPSPAGHQPMETPDGRFRIVYNGELYNDAVVRDELALEGVRFQSSCDTETVLHAVARWGDAAAARMRGMYAFALWDRESRRLTLARDNFGMKPAYWTKVGSCIVFGSEITALLSHPKVSADTDPVTVSSYITTIRTTMDDRTLFAGVQTVRPGEWVVFDCAQTDGIVIDRKKPTQPASPHSDDLKAVINDSVHAHLRSDVPLCSLLSGGLDSTILATIANASTSSLRTYVSGSPDAMDGLADDFAFARIAADAIGTKHTEVPITREYFTAKWPEMIGRLGVPLSTPNEVAITAVAEKLREDGHVVTLSGEGADEIFAGYELPLQTASDWIEANPSASPAEDGVAMLNASAWLPTTNKTVFLRPEFTDAHMNDQMLLAAYEQSAATACNEASQGVDQGDAASVRLRAALDMQRSVNLTGLLQRLDTSMMLASVEGRTPFADPYVLAAADRLPMNQMFRNDTPPATKIALRQAFSSVIPASIATRPKRSFPLPFAGWLADGSKYASESEYLPEVYTQEAIAFVIADPAQHWNLAWPMFNLAIWASRWL